MQSHQITPLFSVEGQKVEAIRELKKQPTKMAVIIECEQERTGRIQYTYEIRKTEQVTVGQEWSAPVGWTAIVRAVIYPWEVEVKTVYITKILTFIDHEQAG